MKAYDKALLHLSRYPKTSKRMYDYLIDKWYDLEEVNEAIVRLQSQQVLNDHEYISLYFESEVIRKGKSIMNIRNKLYQKKADMDMVSDYINEHEERLRQGMSGWIDKNIAQLNARWNSPRDTIRKITAKWYPYGLVKDRYEEVGEQE